jgi:putative membrane protein
MFKRLLTAAAMLAAAFVPAAANAGEDGPGDLEIAHIAYTAGEIDISYAKLAIETSQNKDVRAFAETMLRDHKAVNDAAGALLAKLGVSPQDNATSRTLLENAAAKRAELAALKGAAFDRAYAENELAYHQFVNKAVEESFIPAVENGELRDLLKSALVTFKAHQEHAESLVASLR